jgi:hypothetical protein
LTRPPPQRSLRALLAAAGAFPPQYRLSIWRNLLKLPNARLAYAALRAAGPAPAHADPTPLAALPPRLARRLQATCSALAAWAPVLGEAEGLAAVAFPFVRLFGSDDVGAFEAIATAFLAVLPGFFVDFPHPPTGLLHAVEVRGPV